MGMFDEIRCEYPLPDAIVQDETNTNFAIPSLIKIARALNRKVDFRLLPENDGMCSRSL